MEPENNNTKERWIIDTDPGVDDLMAIIYVLNRPNTEVEFISLVEGNCKMHDVTRNAKRLFKMLGKPIPTFIGCSRQLCHMSKNAYDYHYEDGFGNIDEIKEIDVTDIHFEFINKEKRNLKENINFSLKEGNNYNKEINSESLLFDPFRYSPIEIIKTVNKYPNQINLLMLGPCTNLAAAYMLDNSIANKFKNIVMMGGSFLWRGNITSAAEFNINHDYLSAKVFLNNFKNFLFTCWEPTEFLFFNVSDLEKAKNIAVKRYNDYNDKLYKYLYLIIKKYTQKRTGTQICDLYSIIAYFDKESVLKYFLAECDIIIDSDQFNGATILKNKFYLTDKSNNNNNNYVDLSILNGNYEYKNVLNKLYLNNKHLLKNNHIFVENMCVDRIIQNFSYILKPIKDKVYL